jgi:ABC1 atypical kinase-like domain
MAHRTFSNRIYERSIHICATNRIGFLAYAIYYPDAWRFWTDQNVFFPPNSSSSLCTTIILLHRVVVKVRYPEVERLLRGDVRTITMFAQVAQPVHVPALQEIEHQFMTEFDYVQEAQQMEAVRHNLTKAGLAGPGKLCRVPKAYLEYCTKQVLVMEELKGEKLAVALKQDLAQQAQRQGKTAEEFATELKEQERDAKARGEEVIGPTAKEYDLYISLLDQQRKASSVIKVLHKVFLGWWLPGSRSKTTKDDKSFLPINHAKMMDDLIYIHGHEVLVDGLFNGDPVSWLACINFECLLCCRFCNPCVRSSIVFLAPGKYIIDPR